MVDLVEQLREGVAKKYSRETLETMLTWAADEIERCRACYVGVAGQETRGVSIMYLIVVHAHRLSGYGPFATEAEARTHADKYFQDYRTEIIPYTKVEPDLPSSSVVEYGTCTDPGF